MTNCDLAEFINFAKTEGLMKKSVTEALDAYDTCIREEIESNEADDYSYDMRDYYG